jgi:glycosyltransferase involved in cell wall biosynthesis
MMEQDQSSYDYDVIYLGRLSPEKNPHRLLAICRLLIEKKNDIKVAIVGTGEMEKEVRNKAEEMGLIENVSFLGFQSNPLKILHDSKVMIMTSLWEGTPMCALEAAALGTPIVSTKVDGLKELIANDVNGYLSNDDEVISDKIIHYLSDREKLNELSNNQIARSREWNNVNKYQRSIMYVYERVMKQ